MLKSGECGELLGGIDLLQTVQLFDNVFSDILEEIILSIKGTDPLWKIDSYRAIYHTLFIAAMLILPLTHPIAG